MKKILLPMICLLSQLLMAHTVDYSNVILKHWNISSEKRSVDGSFFMVKNGEVYIEDAKNEILHYPVSSLSKEDQAYVKNRQEQIAKLNEQWMKPASASTPVAKTSIDYRPLGLVAFFLFAGILVFRFAPNEKLKFLMPVLALGVLMPLYSFTSKAICAMQSTTNPLTVDSAFVPFKPNVYTHWDANWFYVECKGIPTNHTMMAGITAWQQQVPIPQCYTGSNAWQIPLNPVMATNPIPVNPQHFSRGAIAIAVNGVPIFNPYTNVGVDAFLAGQLDSFGGHSGRADDYHYHIAPVVLYGMTSTSLPIAYGLDGFAVYGNLEPDGTNVLPLDSNHGHSVPTGVYHYHASAAAPYMIARMAGQVTEDTTHQLIPQPAAHPVRQGQNPLSGAVITGHHANGPNGYTLIYTLNGATDSLVYSWTTNGMYTFNFYNLGGGADTSQTYHGFTQCSLPLGIDDINISSNALSVFPNPSNGIFSIQLSGNIAPRDVQEIMLYNMAGDLVYHAEGFRSAIDSKGLAQGAYILKVQLNNTQLAKKLIVD